MDNPYRIAGGLPVAVSSEFRNAVLRMYPALDSSTQQSNYRGFMQYLLFGSFIDKWTGGLVADRTAVASSVGISPSNHDFRSLRFLARFSEDVVRLDIVQHSYTENRATVVSPRFTPDLRALVSSERLRRRKASDAVWFTTGDPATMREVARIRHRQAAARVAAPVGGNHPADELLAMLNGGKNVVLRKALNRNEDAVRQAIGGLPDNLTRDWSERVFMHVVNAPDVLYAPSPRTARIFPVGTTALHMPRNLRKLWFEGEVDIDLKAAQLAIVATLWGLHDLRSYLEGRGDVWKQLTTDIGASLTAKPIIKEAIYSIVFGAGRNTVFHCVKTGTVDSVGLGAEVASRFMRHKWVRSLLDSRNAALGAIERNGHIIDAFGRKINTSKERTCASLLAELVQSYETRLMLVVLPEIKAERQLYLLAWQHDGCTVHCGDRTQRERQLRRLRNSVEREAVAMGIGTYLEIEEL